jgi:exonuclease III
LEMRKVQWFKNVTWNIRGLGEKEEQLSETLNGSNIEILAIAKGKNKLQGTKETENYAVIYSGVKRYTRGHSGVMICTSKSVSNKIEYCKFWNDRIIETRLNKRSFAMLTWNARYKEFL